MKYRFIVFLLFANLSFRATTASACSFAHTYHVPTTIEMVDQADAVVLARIHGSHRDRESGFTRAELVPFSVLKGGFFPGRVFLEDAIIASSKHPATPSDPKNIVDPNPDALSGGCRRNVFNKGAIVVAFLQEKNGKYIVHAPALSRALEDVPSSDALWVKAVKVYIQIATFPISQRRKEILSKISQLEHFKTDPDSEIIANDLKKSLFEKM